MLMQRVWAMPTADTFDCGPIGDLVQRYLREAKVSVDPFARNKRWATYTNDLNPDTAAEYHMDVHDFLLMLVARNVKADVVLFDPPYSPRQIKECYDAIGRKMGQLEAMRTNWQPERDLINELVVDDGIVLSFGWNSMGMGKKRPYAIEELLLVCHGVGHNDTICMAERRTSRQLRLVDAFPSNKSIKLTRTGLARTEDDSSDGNELLPSDV